MLIVHLLHHRLISAHVAHILAEGIDYAPDLGLFEVAHYLLSEDNGLCFPQRDAEEGLQFVFLLCCMNVQKKLIEIEIMEEVRLWNPFRLVSVGLVLEKQTVRVTCGRRRPMAS
ncbi:hypothetical protein [Brucella sp. 10RB9215]|uniref:hypothetical protein n=1 Tax=Brucella sp. 10RB9215 TaxID=1149953 RepID=UPI0018D84746|nr:hypothetical protein [Brucella sp. 10RB9215]